MIKRSIYISAICLGLLLASGLSETQAQVKQGERIGYVSPRTILQEMPAMASIQKRMENFIQKKQSELRQQQEELQQKITEYQQRQSVISEEAKKKEEEALGKLRADLEESQRVMQQEVQQKQQELVGPLYDEINNAISAVAEEMNLSYVLNTRTTNGDLIILYTSEEAKQKYDITSEVMEELGIGS